MHMVWSYDQAWCMLQKGVGNWSFREFTISGFRHALSKQNFLLCGKRNFSHCCDTKRFDLDPQKKPAYSLPQIYKLTLNSRLQLVWR